ncbi:DUF6759 domain-containing protein [Bergeyella porcorum]|uniref:DUF6759 domain-containing protein n=1 Tax=Bergeyella porcorum TaxID=1735111 RepID=UPI0035E97A88
MNLRKLLFILLMLCSISLLQAQKKKREKYNDILTTTDIERIETFLKEAHPEDPRRSILKPKLVALKNKKWTEGAKNAKPMEARPIITEIPNSVMKHPHSDEAEEFKKLMAESSNAHTEKTVKLLNTLFDQDINNKEAILLVQNNSDCNMIFRIQGVNKEFYNLAVPAKGENSIVLNKGNYTMKSIVCGATYSSSKNIEKGIIIIINNPVAKP